MMQRMHHGTACCLPSAGGVSAFAFQGTNAHAVLSTDLCRAFIARGPATAWMGGRQHARRCWALPPAHVLLRHAAVNSAAARRSEMVFQCDPAAPAVAFLLDHRVRGRALLPATAMVELLAGAAAIAWKVI